MHVDLCVLDRVTMTSYAPWMRSANFSSNVLLQLIYDGGIVMLASLAIAQYLLHTSVRSRMSACDAKCSSSWETHSNEIYFLFAGDLFIFSILRVNLTWQLLWCLPSTAVRSFTQASLVLKIWGYCDACRILLLTCNSCMICIFSSDSF